jgi:lipopolysaccharide export system ATP-binding protein
VIKVLRQQLAGRDPSLPLAVAALLARADESGAATFRDLAVAYREHHLELHRREYGEATRQRGTLSVDEARRHLQTSVLPRLAGAAVLESLPQSVTDEHPVRLREELWRWMQSDVSATRGELMEVALEALKAAEGLSTAAVAKGSTLVAEGLTKSYRRRRVVDKVDLEVNQGQIVGLLGPNGAGKTTSFYMMVGLVRPEAGRISLDGHDISSLPMYRRARLGIGSARSGSTTCWTISRSSICATPGRTSSRAVSAAASRSRAHW